ncbi:MAG TPA: ATP-binding protein [Chloroflexota bacterium]|nr:ATP-binding protein [Chloroflexota bacterium]
MTLPDPEPVAPRGHDTPAASDGVRPLADDFLQRLDGDVARAGGELAADAERASAIGATMFDLPNSQDGTVTVLLPRENIRLAPSQALVRIKSPGQATYLGIVTAGPFAEPDALRGDSHMLVTVATRGGNLLPPYHGRVQVTLLGEEQRDGTLAPPRLRPLPNSPVFALDEAESARLLRAEGDIRLGLVVGYDNLVVGVPSKDKAVLPRHTAVLGTTGGGKSTTIARLVQQARAAGMAVILLDVEGEYTFLHEPTDDQRMLTGLAERGLAPGGVPVEDMTLYHLVGRDTRNPDHPNRRAFSLQFARLSPYAVIEILELSEAQQQRFLKAYDVAKAVMRDLGIFPQKDKPAAELRQQEELLIDLDEFERGYPRLTLPLLLDVVGACLAVADKAEIAPRHPRLQSDEARQALKTRIHAMNVPSNVVSWLALLGRLGRLNRIKVFDPVASDARPLDYKALLQPGRVSVFDLSDSGMSELTNIVIADLLRGVQEEQDTAYLAYERARTANPAAAPPARVLLIIEEAHEFLSRERIEKMPVLFQQVARLAKRGRKRWLGLVFVTQLPQNLPRQVFGLVNSYILHKTTDPDVVSTLQRTVSGIDEGLWRQLPGLAPGQAIVSFPHLARPLLVSVDPTPALLRLVD